jgi:Tfp pilus assembly protein PilO
MALNKRERGLLIVTISAIVLGGNYLLITWLAKPWRDGRVQTLSARQQWQEMQETLQRAPEWQQEFNKLRQDLGEKSEKFQQTSDVLKTLQEVGTASGILPKEWRPMLAQDKGVYRELPVSCRFESTIESLVKFLYGLQTSSGFMNVEELQVTAQPDNPSILRSDIRVQALAAKSGGPNS